MGKFESGAVVNAKCDYLDRTVELEKWVQHIPTSSKFWFREMFMKKRVALDRILNKMVLIISASNAIGSWVRHMSIK